MIKSLLTTVLINSRQCERRYRLLRAPASPHLTDAFLLRFRAERHRATSRRHPHRPHLQFG
jgi:hypothetical protein